MFMIKLNEIHKIGRVLRILCFFLFLKQHVTLVLNILDKSYTILFLLASSFY